MQIVKDIYLDFYQGEMVVVTAKQGDVGRFLRVTLLDNGNAFQIPAGATATIARGDGRNRPGPYHGRHGTGPAASADRDLPGF